jgi:hypothetical protein
LRFPIRAPLRQRQNRHAQAAPPSTKKNTKVLESETCCAQGTENISGPAAFFVANIGIVIERQADPGENPWHPFSL